MRVYHRCHTSRCCALILCMKDVKNVEYLLRAPSWPPNTQQHAGKSHAMFHRVSYKGDERAVVRYTVHSVREIAIVDSEEECAYLIEGVLEKWHEPRQPPIYSRVTWLLSP